MKSIVLITSVALLMTFIAHAQRGTISIPPAASLTIPLNAQVCADTIFANGATHGTLTIANANCLCAGAIVTPVELIVFSAELEEGIVRLRWQTASETNCAGFEIQRSLNDISWHSLGFVEGHGTTSMPNAYHFDDRDGEGMNSSMLYFKLKVIDTDGSYRYSPIVVLALGGRAEVSASFVLYPNPAGEFITITGEGEVTLTLRNILGQKVFVTRSMRGEHIRLPHVGNGIYIAEIQAGKHHSYSTLVIQQMR